MIDVGPGARVRQHSENAEYIGGGFDRPTLSGPFAAMLRRVQDETPDRATIEDYDAMTRDDAAGSSVDLLIASALQDGIQHWPVIEDVEVDEGSYEPGDAEKAWDIHTFVQRALAECVDQLRGEVRATAFDGMVFRGGLSEVVSREVTSGRDKGKLYVDRIKSKHRSSYEPVADRAGNLLGIRPLDTARKGGKARRAPISIDKFMFMAWQPRAGDIFGTSIYDAAFPYWNFKVQLLPLWWDYLSQFAVPNYHAEADPSTEPRRPLDPETGEEDPDAPLQHPVVAMYNELSKILGAGGRLICTPAGAKINVLEPGGTGDSFDLAREAMDRAITRAILWAARSVMESTHSSKSDNEGALDVLGIAVQSVKSWIAESIRAGVIRPLVRRNFGEDAARRFTPLCALGQIDRRDFSRYANSFARLADSGVITSDERLDVLSMLGLRTRRRRRGNAGVPLEPMRPRSSPSEPERSP